MSYQYQQLRQRISEKKGLIKTLILIVIGVIFLSIVGFDIRTAVEDEQTQANFSYLTTIGMDLYNRYLADIGSGLWRIFQPFLSVVYDTLINFNWNNINSNIPAAPDLNL